ncbi:hypothetical protein LZ190_25480, partial [Rhodovulum sulfidophilum]|nr:hypothetical protein [Rhodovulum sulfidophilum]
MDQAAVAARLAELHGSLETLRRQGRILGALAAVLVGAVVWLAAGSALLALATGLLAALATGLLTRLRAAAVMRNLTDLERAHP